MLLKGATLVGLDPPHVEPGDLRIEGEKIAERGRDLGGGDSADFSGCLVLPGLVNAHTHLYSALARGMPWPAPPPRNFIEIREKVWWRLDRALDEDAVYHSAMAGAVEAALSGTTMLIDHHSSPSFIAGSLDTIRRAVEAVGLRSVLGYETTDRNGTAGRDAGLDENRRFLSAPPGPLTRGLVGAHASFTLSDDSLSRLAELAEATGSSLHVHVAEDRADRYPTATDLVRLKSRLYDIINLEQDQVLFIPLCRRCADMIESLGRSVERHDAKDVLIVT